VAVFVDGCFFHGCPSHYTSPKTNSAYWAAKVAENRARDTDTDARLQEAEWEVVRIWQHEDPEEAAARVAAVVRRRRGEAGDTGLRSR
jgi:DNA mismatch endonuclease (patch repair protein)